MRSFFPEFVLAALLALGLAACGGPDEGSLGVTVAEVGDRSLTAGDFQVYLKASLPADLEEEETDPEESARVKSRLFDAFLDEEVLLVEAARREFRVEPREIELYLEIGSPEGEEGREHSPAERKTAERVLLVQKLLDSAGTRDTEVTEDEVEAFLRERGEDAVDGGTVVLRSLMMETEKLAASVHRDIRRRRRTFEEAVVAYEPTPGQADPRPTPLGNLPAEVVEAVGSLKPGQVSHPVTVHGQVYLFFLVSRSDSDPGGDPVARAAARAELLRRRRDEAVAGLLDDLKNEIPVQTFPDRLPFGYVAEPD